LVTVAAGDPVMTTQAFDPIAHARDMRDGGFWLDRTVDEYLVDAITRTPE